jgi:hypothetical protein
MNRSSYIHGSFKLTHFAPLARYLVLFLPALLIFAEGCNHEDKKIVTSVNFVDFAPDDGDYDINWPGPPRRPWTEKDKEYYTATIELSVPAPESFSLPFYVKESRFWSDTELGWFMANFAAGSTRSQPKFWLVATKAGRIRGNIVKGDDRHAEVYLKPFGFASDVDLDTWTWNFTARTWYHDVESK